MDKLVVASTWGLQEKATGKWIGSVGAVAYGQVAFAMCSVIPTIARKAVVDFTEAVFFDEVIFMSQTPTAELKGRIFSGKVSGGVWMANLAAFLIVTGLVVYSGKVGANQKKKQKQKTSVSTTAFEILAILLKQTIRGGGNGYYFHYKLNSTRIALASWMLAALLLANAYSSVFYAVLTVPELERPLDTVQQLLRAAQTDSRSIITQQQSAMYASIAEAEPGGHTLYYALQQHMKRTGAVLTSSGSQMIPRIEADPKTVMVTLKNGATVRRFLSASKRLHISSESLELIDLAWLIPKKSPLRTPFNIM